jgi:hypothetical protein
MLVGRHDHAPARACVDVDVRVHTALADQPELVETLEQGRPDLGPFADEDQDLGVFQARGQRIGLLGVIVPDLNLMALQFPETGERPQGIEVIVENRDTHDEGSRGQCERRAGWRPSTMAARDSYLTRTRGSKIGEP